MYPKGTEKDRQCSMLPLEIAQNSGALLSKLLGQLSENPSHEPVIAMVVKELPAMLEQPLFKGLLRIGWHGLSSNRVINQGRGLEQVAIDQRIRQLQQPFMFWLPFEVRIPIIGVVVIIDVIIPVPGLWRPAELTMGRLPGILMVAIVELQLVADATV